MKKSTRNIIRALSFIIIIFIGLCIDYRQEIYNENTSDNTTISYEITDIPEYTGKIYIEINNNIPKFEDKDFNIKEDYYSKLKNGKVRNGNDKNKLAKG